MDRFDAKFIARAREKDGKTQALSEHLLEVAELSKGFASKINLPLSGQIIGLTHDLGKYSEKFQDYIRCVTGMKGVEELKRAKLSKGEVDHATAGAQKIWSFTSAKAGLTSFIMQILSTCVAYHHGGLPDCISSKGDSPFLKRLSKTEKESFYEEVNSNADIEVLEKINEILASPNKLISEFKPLIQRINSEVRNGGLRQFYYGLLTRFLFSCLIDADRQNSAAFDDPASARFRTGSLSPDWRLFIELLEKRLAEFKPQNEVDNI